MRDRQRETPIQIVISTFPPKHCGIGRYADQFAERLSEQGRQVLRIALPQGHGDKQVRLDGRLRPLRLLGLTRRRDELWIMWGPSFYVSGGRLSRILSWASMGVVLRRRSARVVMHEPDHPVAPGRHWARSMPSKLEAAAAKWFWKSPSTWMFHTERNRCEFLDEHPFVQRTERTELLDHGAGFRPSAVASRSRAREQLGLDEGATILLCLGFIGSLKGFDRAVRAFAIATSDSSQNAELHIVGSAIYETPQVRDYINGLEELVRRTPYVELHEEWVSDAEFDLWLQACDVLVAPYVKIYSSSVVERARMFGRPAIVTAVGGLPEQIGDGDTVVANDAELATAIAAAISGNPNGDVG